MVEDTRVATVENGEVTVVAPGVTNILLKQAASGNFAASEEISLPLTVNKRPLYVRVDDASRNYGEPNPEFVISYEGFVAGDNEESLTQKPVATCVADTLSLGSFPIVLSGGVSDLYTFVYTNGTLTIGSVTTALSVAEIGEKVYGDQPFALPVVTTNSNRGEISYTIVDESVATIVDGRIHIKGAGTTTLVVKQAATDSHTSAEASVPLVVSKALLTVTADNKECRQGDELPELTYTCKGFVAGEDETVFTVQPELSCEVSTTEQAGTYLISVTGGEAANYEIAYYSGTLTVGNFSETQLTVAEIGEKVYGDLPFALPAVTTNNSRGEISYTIVNESVATIVDGRIHIKGAGTTLLVVKQKATETFSDAEVWIDLVVAKAPLTVVAEDKRCDQGDAMPEWTLRYSGFVWGEDTSSLDIQPQALCEVSDTAEPGTYEISVSGGNAANYEFVYRPGTLTIVAHSGLTSVDGDEATLYYAEGKLYLTGVVAQLSIFDISGSEVKRIVTPQNEVSIDELPAGHYVVVAESDNRVMRYRFVKE